MEMQVRLVHYYVTCAAPIASVSHLLCLAADHEWIIARLICNAKPFIAFLFLDHLGIRLFVGFL